MINFAHDMVVVDLDNATWNAFQYKYDICINMLFVYEDFIQK